MARRRRKRKQLDLTPREIRIESMAHDGRGVGRGELYLGTVEAAYYNIWMKVFRSNTNNSNY